MRRLAAQKLCLEDAKPMRGEVADKTLNNKLVFPVILLFLIAVFLCFSCEVEERPDCVEIPFVVENGRLALEANVNGKKGRFIFDTGSTESYLDVNVRNLWLQGFTKTIYKGRPSFAFIYKLNKIELFGNFSLRTTSA
ncbi:MAG: hypothetical protein LBC53_07500 [Spirochaetaceae bacterium]|jgi:hypothetical protein|nr:hypothetical protein [Spirochaetaceae bacterium]